MEAILATDINGGISKDGTIPWKSKKDMTFFFQKTKNNIVIMGRNTYFSLPEKVRPLKDRLNIVLTREPYNYINNDENMKHPNLLFTDDENIHLYIEKNRAKIYELYNGCNVSLSRNFKIYIIGGKQIYEKYIPLCDTVWHTTIKKDYSCDLFLNYYYSILFKEAVPLNEESMHFIEEDEELRITLWKKIF